MIKVISWNCRGLGSERKKEMVRNLLRSKNPHVLFLQETKMKDYDVLQASTYFWKTSQGKAVSSKGASGGICTLWNPNIFQQEDWESDSNWLMVSLCHLPSGKLLSFLNIYMPSINKDKEICWLSIFSLLNQTRPTSLIFVGDFNTTMHNFEKRGGSIVREASRESMEDLLSTFDLMDIRSLSVSLPGQIKGMV
jgi:exonuclease III